MRSLFLLCLVLLPILGYCQDAAIESGLHILEANRDLDISSQLVKETVKFEFENTGKSSLQYIVFAVHKNFAKNLAHIDATMTGKTDKLKTAKVTVKGAQNEDSYYRIDLAQPIGAGQKSKIQVDATYTHALHAYPSHISQSEQQQVVYEGNVHVLSPYKIVKEKTVVKLSPGSLESFTKEQPAKHEGDTITYGPYENTEPFSFKELRIHYENNSPFLTVSKLDRVIEISNWGNIAVEETLEIVHTGAILKGSFSRFDFQRDRRERMPAVQHFKTVLPAAARDVYYRDEIGNISTSHLRIMEDSVEMEIRPRFPLMGGWKTNYYIGYNVPSYEYLFVSGNKYVLKMRFVDHIFDKFIVDKMTLKVILPEGAKDVQLKAPYKIELGKDEKHYTYLDIDGRPVKIVHKGNLVEQHIQDFELQYTFDRMTLIREPLMVIVSFYLLFLVVIIWVRLDFTIAKDAQSEARLKVAGIIEQVSDMQSERVQHYDSWIDAINKYKNSKDGNAMNTAKKTEENNLKNVAQKMTDLQAQLKTENADIAEKVAEILRLDKAAREHLNNWTQLTERLVGGKLQKAAHAEQEKVSKSKVDECREKMDTITYSL